MSCKHSTPPPQSQRACPEPSSKAKIPTSLPPFLDKFEKKPVFCQKKTKNPTSPSQPICPLPPTQPIFIAFRKK